MIQHSSHLSQGGRNILNILSFALWCFQLLTVTALLIVEPTSSSIRWSASALVQSTTELSHLHAGVYHKFGRYTFGVWLMLQKSKKILFQKKVIQSLILKVATVHSEC